MKGYVRIVTDDKYNGRVGYILERYKEMRQEEAYHVTFDLITPFEEQKLRKDVMHSLMNIYPFTVDELKEIDGP